MPLTWSSKNLRALGSTINIHLLASPSESTPALAKALLWLKLFEDEVSRFRDDSQTTALNQQGHLEQPGSRLRRTVQASRWAAELTGGLVDPLMVDHLQAGDYARSRIDGPELDWLEALQTMPHHPASPDPHKRWQQIVVSEELIRLPSETAYDPGAVGKGLAADTLVQILRRGAPSATMICADCGGDVALWSKDEPWSIELQDPRRSEPWSKQQIASAAIATSAITRRVWLAQGRPWHHLLSPGDGQPVSTGIAGVTAEGPSALEAEVRAKWVLLSGDPSKLIYGGWVYWADGRPPERVEPSA